MTLSHAMCRIGGIGCSLLLMTAIEVQQAAAYACPLPQAPGGSDDPDETPASAGGTQAGGVKVQFAADKDYGTGTVTRGDALKEAQEYVASKGWDGMSIKDDGSGFIVFVASAPISGGDEKSFDARRTQGYRSALLEAKKAMVNYLKQTVQTSVQLLVRQGRFAEEARVAANGETSDGGVLARLKALALHELDKECEKRGIRTTSQSPKDKAEAEAAAESIMKELVESRSFEQATSRAAEEEVSGVQAFRTFETVGPNGEGKVAVVAIYSPKSAALQQALLGRGAAPVQMPAVRPSQWAREQGPGVLLYTHGAQVRVNERGELILVGFGQATPQSDSSTLVDTAQKRAELRAVGEIRRFMGELVSANSSEDEKNNLEVYSAGASAFDSTDGYWEKVAAVGKALDLSGIQSVYTWSYRHPSNTHETQGAVVVLSVSEMIAANHLRDKMKAAGGAAGGQGGTTLRRPAGGSSDSKKPVTPGKGSSGAGAEGVDP